MTVVGEAFIEVKPDTANFSSELTAQLSSAAQEITVPIGPEPGLGEEVQAELDSVPTGDITVPIGPEEGLAAEVESEIASISVPSVEVPVVPDTSAMAAQGVIASDALGAGLLAGAKKFAAPLAGAFSIKVGIDELVAQQEVLAVSDRLIKTTGGSAKVTTEDVTGLAESLQEVAAVDAELIQQGENVLLTFRNVRNEVGAGNDVFDRTVESSLDVARVLRTDMRGGLVQLGKAVNDPVRGVTALTRAGIQFSDQQKNQIKTLVESNDLLGAQKVVLNEVESQVGRAAAAYGDTLGGQLDKAAIAGEDFLANVIRPFVPLIGDAADAVVPLSEGLVKLVDLTEGAVAGVIDVLHLQDEITAATSATVDSPKVQAAIERVSKIPVVFRDSESAAYKAMLATSGFTGELADAAGESTVVRDLLGQVNDALGLTNSTAYSAEIAVSGVTDSFDGFAPEVKGSTDALEENTKATKDNILAQLELTGGFVGLQATLIDNRQAHDDYAAAQAKVHELAADGKRGTAEFAEAFRDLRSEEVNVIQSQLEVEGSLISYGRELKESGQKQKDVNQLMREYGKDAGLSKGAVDRLIGTVQAKIDKDKQVPKSVSTTYEAPGLEGIISQFDRFLSLSTQLESSLNRNVDNLGKI